MDGIPNSVDVSMSKLQKTVENREAWCAAVHGGHRVGHDLATEQHESDMTYRLTANFPDKIGAKIINSFPSNQQ